MKAVNKAQRIQQLWNYINKAWKEYPGNDAEQFLKTLPNLLATEITHKEEGKYYWAQCAIPVDPSKEGGLHDIVSFYWQESWPNWGAKV
jgi:hypothetical protein